MSITDTTPADFQALAAKLAHPSVIVFSKPNCIQCEATYRSLTKKGIVYEVVDVTADEAALAHVVELGYQQMPVVETQDDHWSGHRIDKISALHAALAAA